MDRYFVDTNVFIKYLFDDGTPEHKLARDYFEQAKEGIVAMTFLREVLLEIEFVLKKKFGMPKEERQEAIFSLLYSPYINVIDRELLLHAFTIYYSRGFDLVDVLVSAEAQRENAKVLSFDKDIEKLLY